MRGLVAATILFAIQYLGVMWGYRKVIRWVTWQVMQVTRLLNLMDWSDW